MAQKIAIYDTTLRDGNQALGISLSLSDKLSIAKRLSELGIPYIEGGWPNPTNSVDTEFYKQVRDLKLAAKIAAFGSTRRPGIQCQDDPFMAMLIESKAPVITMFGKSWDLHVHHVINTTLEENLAMIAESVEYCKKHKREVIYDAEHFFDGYKANPDYALATVDAAVHAGADTIVLCDTNGGLLTDDFIAIWNEVKLRIKAPLGVHLHNDAGCAEANSCQAALLGAVQIQGTINGLGERCGNANLCTIIANLQQKRGMPLLAPDKLASLTAVSIFVSEIANVSHNIRQPYVGEAAFSHKAGAHADGVRKVRQSFEHIDPVSIGNTRRFIVSNQAGSSTLLERLDTILPGLDKKDARVKKLLARIKELEEEGYQFEAAEASFELVARKVFEMLPDSTFKFNGFRVIEEKRENGEVFSEATIKVTNNNITVHTAAEGDGPVNALDNALRKALVNFFPVLSSVKLEDFKVRVLDGTEGTAAKVRVLIESSDGVSRWSTVGVSTNVIEASWLALIDSLHYKLLLAEMKPASVPKKQGV